jgi:hypothetical protein
MRHKCANGLRRDLGQCHRPCATGSDHRSVGAGDGGDGVEVIVGVSCDPQLRPVLLFGGGVMVEVYNDVALRRCPITRSEAQAMIAEVKGARLLQGFRGRPAADLEALEDTLVACCTSPWTLKDTWRSWTSIR